MAVSGSVTASSFRIGNLIYKRYPDGKEIVSVESISKYFINGLGISLTEPIPVSNYWLEKLGFQKASEFDKFGGYLISTGKDDFKVRLIDFTYDFNVFGLQFEYVHEIQNWFYFLTGIELTDR